MFGSIIKSKEQRIEDSKKFSEKLFPFGDKQKALAETQLRLIAGDSVQDPMLFFFYVDAKTKLLTDIENNDFKRAIKILKKTRPRVSEDALHDIISLMILDIRLEEMNQFPSIDEIRDFSKHLTNSIEW